jgi:predicted enzyme related to lactoylglutathione lyase
VLRADAGGVRLDQTRGDAGQVAHLEIPAQDTRSAREFWGGLFGWEWQQFEGPSEYHMTRIDDRSGAAIMAAR